MNKNADTANVLLKLRKQYDNRMTVAWITDFCVALTVKRCLVSAVNLLVRIRTMPFLEDFDNLDKMNDIEINK